MTRENRLEVDECKREWRRMKYLRRNNNMISKGLGESKLAKYSVSVITTYAENKPAPKNINPLSRLFK